MAIEFGKIGKSRRKLRMPIGFGKLKDVNQILKKWKLSEKT